MRDIVVHSDDPPPYTPSNNLPNNLPNNHIRTIPNWCMYVPACLIISLFLALLIRMALAARDNKN